MAAPGVLFLALNVAYLIYKLNRSQPYDTDHIYSSFPLMMSYLYTTQ